MPYRPCYKQLALSHIVLALSHIVLVLSHIDLALTHIVLALSHIVLALTHIVLALSHIVRVLVEGAPASVHEEVADGGHLELQLVCDGRLDVLVGAVSLLEDGEQGAPLDVSEDETGLLAGEERPPQLAPGRLRSGGEGGAAVTRGGEGGITVSSRPGCCDKMEKIMFAFHMAPNNANNAIFM